ncbi:MAG TPA: T9SS type A sorting domain-containing protein, partial [Cyclobacteriaceae bacterium]|nr:T9SS type A sorting domain-containing protein [Cyclobacteriaceae bacterium]
NAKEGNSFRIHVGKDLHDRIKPTAVTLGNPFPNPANSSATISFSLPESKSSYKVQLEVYNSVGQRTAVLVNDTLQAGFYTSTWDIESNKAGLYFYRLSVSSKGVQQVLTEKIIINR